MTWKSKASKRTILSTFGAETSACRDALDLAECTRALLCEVVIGGRVLPDEWGEEHMPIRAITDCKGLFDCLAKDASVPEDRGTALTVASLRAKCSAKVGRDQKRSGLMWVPTRVQLADGLTKSSAGVFLRNALTSGTAQLHEESTKVLRRKQLTRSSKRFRASQRRQWILSRKIGGGEDKTQESPAQDPSRRTFTQLGYLQLPTTDLQSISHFFAGLW